MRLKLPDMKNPLSQRSRNIQPSPTLAVDARAKALQAEGKPVCGFGTGEPDFDTPEFIKEACARALRDGKTKYAPTPGIPALRQAWAEKMLRDNGLEQCEAGQVVISPGGKYSCHLAIQVLCDPGDEVLIPAPYWVSYPEMVRLADAVPVILPTRAEEEFCLSVEQLRAAITDRTKLLILNSPSNPTGCVYPEALVREIVELCLQKGIYILSDEIYEYLLYDGVTHFSPASISPQAARQIITVSGFSKTFSMTGWRLGTLVADAPIAKAVADYQSQTTSNATTFAQFGALAALQNWQASLAALASMKEVFCRRRDTLHAALSALPGFECVKASGAFYLFPDISGTGMDPDLFCERILEEELVAIVSGTGFGYASGLRFSYATSDEIIAEGIRRLQRFCSKLG